MKRSALGLLCLTVAVWLAAGCGGGSGASSGPTTGAAAPAATAAPSSAPAGGGGPLDAVVGPGFTITLTENGKPVTHLAAGTYTIVVDDKADIHNFHLTGPGVDKATDVAGTGKQTWTVTLKPGSYRYQCDPHATSMKGEFTVS